MLVLWTFSKNQSSFSEPGLPQHASFLTPIQVEEAQVRHQAASHDETRLKGKWAKLLCWQDRVASGKAEPWEDL